MIFDDGGGRHCRCCRCKLTHTVFFSCCFYIHTFSQFSNRPPIRRFSNCSRSRCIITVSPSCSCSSSFCRHLQLQQLLLMPFYSFNTAAKHYQTHYCVSAVTLRYLGCQKCRFLSRLQLLTVQSAYSADTRYTVANVLTSLSL